MSYHGRFGQEFTTTYRAPTAPESFEPVLTRTDIRQVTIDPKALCEGTGGVWDQIEQMCLPAPIRTVETYPTIRMEPMVVEEIKPTYQQHTTAEECRLAAGMYNSATGVCTTAEPIPPPPQPSRIDLPGSEEYAPAGVVAPSYTPPKLPPPPVPPSSGDPGYDLAQKCKAIGGTYNPSTGKCSTAPYGYDPVQICASRGLVYNAAVNQCVKPEAKVGKPIGVGTMAVVGAGVLAALAFLR